MKKLLAILIAVASFFSCFAFTGCTPRSEQLKMLIPGEYIDETIFPEFEEWYFEQTGNKIKVMTPALSYVSEDIITAVVNDHADYDVICPSDFAVEQFVKKNLLVKVDKARVDVESVIRPEYVERARISDPTLEYSVPYMYGTYGIMYDYKKTGKHIDSWSAIYTDEFVKDGKKVVANKDSLREAITSAAIWANRNELNEIYEKTDSWSLEYTQKLQDVFDDVSDNALAKVKTTLEEMKNYQLKWGGEELKVHMATNNTSIEVALTWSCDAGYVMNDFEDEDGNIIKGNRDLWYVIPKEGGNIYLDTFCITKYAKNVEAAQYFLEFICQKEIAMRNSIYAGAVSPVKAAYQQLLDDYTYAFELDADADEEWVAMYMDMLFPSNETLARCATMRYYGDEADAKVSNLWNDVRYK
ncbi:MAG: extracellular solute-binding protein [Clostridiales bacterium]|nr:extracellular solute-binding protein [Clostridiales bacterium]